MKSVFLLFSVCSHFLLYSQATIKKISEKRIVPPTTTIGVNLGGNFSSLQVEDNDTVFSTNFDSKLGAHLGVKLSHAVNKVVQLQTGLLFDIKGFRARRTILSGIPITTVYHTFYLSIPVNFQFNYTPKQTSWGLFARTGLFYGRAIQGFTRTRSSSLNNIASQVEDRKLRFGRDQSDDFRRGELGYSIGGGFILETFEFGIIYEQSFSSIAPVSTNGLRSTNNVLKVSFTYFFTEKP